MVACSARNPCLAKTALSASWLCLCESCIFLIYSSCILLFAFSSSLLFISCFFLTGGGFVLASFWVPYCAPQTVRARLNLYFMFVFELGRFWYIFGESVGSCLELKPPDRRTSFGKIRIRLWGFSVRSHTQLYLISLN